DRMPLDGLLVLGDPVDERVALLAELVRGHAGDGTERLIRGRRATSAGTGITRPIATSVPPSPNSDRHAGVSAAPSATAPMTTASNSPKTRAIIQSGVASWILVIMSTSTSV